MLHWSRFVMLVSLLFPTLLGCGRRDADTPLTEATKLLAQNEHIKAIAKCDEILAIEPTNYDAMVLRGQANSKFDRINEAIADFTQAIELVPNRPDAYRWRYRIYMDLAKQEPDLKNKMIFEQAAAADHKNLTRYDPNAATTFKNRVSSLPKSLTNPIPGYDPLEQKDEFAVDDADPFKAAERAEPDVPGLLGASEEPKFGELDDGTRGPDEHGVETQQDSEQKTDLVAKQDVESGEEVIEQLDLDNGMPDELTLPPHTGVFPNRPVTRFDRQSFQPFDPGNATPRETTLPQVPRGATTGIAQPADQFDDEERQPGRFFLQNQLGGTGFTSSVPTQQLRSTGIRSTAPSGFAGPGVPRQSNSRFGNTQPGIGPLLPRTMLNQGLPTGFLPPGAQDSFGPRIAQDPAAQPQSQGRNAANRGQGGAGPAPRIPGAGNPILTTAIPGTTTFYGTPQGNRQEAGRYAPALSDPNYSPFVPRQTGIQTTPDLPRQ